MKTPTSFLFPSNFRNQNSIKRLIKEFNVQGYGVVVYLLETLSETTDHKYPINDIDLLADEMKVSVPIIRTIIENYGLFEVSEDTDGQEFFSTQLNEWLEPYYRKVKNASRAGKISALKKKKKQEEQLKKLSQYDSSQRPLNTCLTINKLTNKSIYEMNDDNGDYDWKEHNENQVKKDMNKDKKERREQSLYEQGRETQIDIDIE